MINYGKHYIDKNDIKTVNKVLKGNFLTQGPIVDLFQKARKIRVFILFHTVFKALKRGIGHRTLYIYVKNQNNEFNLRIYIFGFRNCF